MTDRVRMTIVEGVADVRLNRADKLNAFDRAMFEGMEATLAELGARNDVRCVVLSGEGRGFCAGIDLASLTSDPSLRDLMARSHGDANIFQNAAWGWRTLEVPVIAAVHGVAFGAGCQVMLGADIRIATPDARISIMEARWGLTPDVAGFPLLRGLVRDDIARDLVLTGRQISGEEAAQLGVVTRTAADPLAEALAYGRTIAGLSPQGVRASKRMLNRMADASDAELLLAESIEQEVLLASAGHREALAAHAEGRAPVYPDYDPRIAPSIR